MAKYIITLLKFYTWNSGLINKKKKIEILILLQCHDDEYKNCYNKHFHADFHHPF